MFRKKMEVFGSDHSQTGCKMYFCNICNYKTSRKSSYDKHLATDNHQIRANGSIVEVSGSIGSQTGCKKLLKQVFKCPDCDYSTSQKTRFDKHKCSKKLQKCNLVANKLQNEDEIGCKKIFSCPKCDKIFKTHGGLWKHSQKCGVENENVIVSTQAVPVPTLQNQVDEMKKQNQEFKELIITQSNQMMEMTKQMTSGMINNTNNSTSNSHNTTNVNQSNSHNKTFNLQFFLNETCKDAMNITDFVKSIQLSLGDLEKVGELGYAEGMSRALVKGLNELEVTKRPIHCSDLKREIIHIKDQDKWEKDTYNQDKLKSAIKQIGTKNIMLLDDWRRENPGCTEYDNTKNDMYLKMQVETIGPMDSVSENRDFGKIIRTIAKNTIIHKESYTS